MISAFKCRIKAANYLPRTYLRPTRILMKKVSRKIKEAMRHGEFQTVYIFPSNYHFLAPDYVQEYLQALGYQTNFEIEKNKLYIEW